jgi:hypothetical protein
MVRLTSQIRHCGVSYSHIHEAIATDALNLTAKLKAAAV